MDFASPPAIVEVVIAGYLVIQRRICRYCGFRICVVTACSYHGEGGAQKEKVGSQHISKYRHHAQRRELPV